MNKLLFAALIILSTTALAQEPPKVEPLKIVNIRVGQGDATLIQGPQKDEARRVNVLVDAGDIGNRDGGHILRAVLTKHGVDKLDYMIMTHADADHIGGVIKGRHHGTSILWGFDNAVGCVGDDDNDGNTDWLPGKKDTSPDLDEIGECGDLIVENWVDYGHDLFEAQDTAAADKYNALANTIGHREVLNNQTSVDNFEIDLGHGAIMKSYAANGFIRGGEGSRVKNVNTPNERSLSFLVTFGDFDFLISGDLIGRKAGAENARVEERVAQAISDDGRSVDVLHVNHHGADNGSSRRFLSELKPNIAVISAGNGNTHKHPENAALSRLARADVYRILLTSFGTSEDRISASVRDHLAVFQGDIVIESDGSAYEISTKRAFHANVNCVREPDCSKGAKLKNEF